MIRDNCEKCEDVGDYHGPTCVVRKVIFNRNNQNQPERHEVLEAAVIAFEKHIQKQKDKSMATHLVKQDSTETGLAQKFGFTESQLELIRNKVAKNATPEELELFFYQCKVLEMNPLMPGQIYFLKFKNRTTGEFSPGTIVIGIDGFRSRAMKSGKLNGIKRGVIRNDKGQCIGAWADVYRKDSEHPFHEEVPLNEYFQPNKDQWKNMPETMIKKVAEVAALRMAFPLELAGIYSHEEMDQAEKRAREFDTETKTSHATSHAEPKTVQIEHVTPNVSVEPEEDEVCCGKRMILSKFSDHLTGEKPLWCTTCKSKRPVQKKTDSPQLNEMTDTIPSEPIIGDIIDASFEITADPEPAKELPWKKYLPKEDPRMVK